jgi:hypothetical protein
MIVIIKPTEDENQFQVNGKAVRRDMDGAWKETDELTQAERRFFAEYLSTNKLMSEREITATYIS